MKPFPFTWEQAQQRQHLYHSRYTVWLVNPSGQRSYLSYTARKTGAGLQTILHNQVKDDARRAELEQIMGLNLNDLSYDKKGQQLNLSNGWKVVFGGTIMQEAAR